MGISLIDFIEVRVDHFPFFIEDDTLKGTLPLPMIHLGAVVIGVGDCGGGVGVPRRTSSGESFSQRLFGW